MDTGIYDVKVDSDVSYCTPMATTEADVGQYATARTLNGNLVRVITGG